MDRLWYEARTGLDRHSILATFSKSVTGAFNISLAANDSITAFIRWRANVGPIWETVELVKFFRSSLKLAVVTNSEDVVAAASLNQIGLHGHFDHIFSISMGLPPKPAPNLFVAAANAMMVRPDKALIFEDSNEGVRAGLMAGNDVVQIMPRHVLDTKGH